METLRQMVDVSTWEISAVDIGVMAGYFVLMVIVGLLCKSISKDISDYVRMGCKSTWWLMGTSIFMLMTSASSLTGSSAQAYMSGWSFLVMGAGGFLGWLCMAAFFAPWMRRTRAITPPDAIRLRYGQLVEQVNAYIGAVGGMLWGGVWLYSFALFMAVIFKVPLETVIIFVGIIVVFYSVSGGSWSVQITDTLQGYILVPIALVVFFLSMNEIGWFDGIFKAIREANLEDDYKIIMAVDHKYTSPVGNVGKGYFSWPWLVASFIYSFALSANITSCWRFLSCKTDADARKAALLAGCLLFFGSAVWYMPGMVARLKFEDKVIALQAPKEEAKAETDAEKQEIAGKGDETAGSPVAETGAATAAEAVEDTDAEAGAAAVAEGEAVPTDKPPIGPTRKPIDLSQPPTGPPEGKEAEEKGRLYLSNPAEGAYAVVAKELLPPGLIGLVVIALLAATMSSLDSSLTGNAGIICNNIYPALVRAFGKEPWTGKKLLRLTQLVNFMLGIWAIILAFLVKEGAQKSGIYQVSLNIIALVSLPMVLSMVLSFFIRKLPSWAPLVGMFFGFLGSATFMFSGKVAGWAADAPFVSDGVAASLQGFADWIGSLMWHDKVYINLGLTIVPTFATSLWWYTATPEYRARVDNFFKQIHTPIDFKKEVGQDVDHSLMKMIGWLGLAIAAVVAVLIFFAKNDQGEYDRAGVLSVLFVVAFIAGISTIMLLLGLRKERQLKLAEEAGGGDQMTGGGDQGGGTAQ